LRSLRRLGLMPIDQPNIRHPVIGYNLLPIFPWDRGGYYYGSPWSYYYPGPYYGGPYTAYGTRLPYVCGLYGYC
jgi:hypothetical protein